MFTRFGGVDQHSGDLAIDPTSAIEINNVDLHPVGEIRTRGGLAAVAINPGGTGGILSLAMLEGPSDRYLYAAKPGGLYRTAGLASPAFTWTAPTTWTGATRARFAHARFGVTVTGHPTARGSAVYFASGKAIPWADWGTGGQVLPKAKFATSTAGVPNGATTGATEWRDWEAHPPTGLCLVGRGTTEQMFAWGFPDDPNRIDYSALQFPWHWCRDDLSGAVEDPTVDGGYFYALPDESDVVVGVVQMLTRIVVFKRRTTIVYSGYPGDNLAVENIYPVGCTSYESAVRVGTQLLWWSDQGPVSLFGVQEFGDLQYAVISDPVRQDAAAVTAATSAAIFAVHDRKNMRVAWFLPAGEGSRALVYYYDSPQRWTIFTGRLAEMSCGLESLAVATNETTVYGGSPEGDIYTMFTATSDAGELIAARFVTAWQAIAEHDVRKRMLYVDLMFGGSGGIDAVVEAGWDYSVQYEPGGRIVRVIGNPGLGWDDPGTTWSYDSDDYVEFVDHGTPLPIGTALWDATTRMIARYSLIGTGFIYHLRLSSVGHYPMHFAGWRAFLSDKGMR